MNLEGLEKILIPQNGYNNSVLIFILVTAMRLS
jgi:hypothetical protein